MFVIRGYSVYSRILDCSSDSHASPKLSILGGSGVVISEVIRKVAILTTHLRGFETPLITTREPPISSLPSISSHKASVFGFRVRQARATAVSTRHPGWLRVLLIRGRSSSLCYSPESLTIATAHYNIPKDLILTIQVLVFRNATFFRYDSVFCQCICAVGGVLSP